MSIEIIPREKWGAAKPKSRTPRPPETLAGVAIHWFGSPKAARSHDGCEALLRSVQRSHMTNKKENYADIAYNHAVCPHGFAYELRGFGVQTGANGTSAANRSHAAIVYMAGEDDRFTDEAKPVLGELIRMWREKGAGPDVKPHGFFTGSTCPGKDIRSWLESGGWTKVVPAEPKPALRDDTPPWLVEFIEWRLVHDGDLEKRPNGIPKRVPASAWEAAVQVHRIANMMGPQQPFLDWAEWRLAGAKKADRPRSLPAAVPKPWWDALKRIQQITKPGAKEKAPAKPKPTEKAEAEPAPSPVKIAADTPILSEPRATRVQLERFVLSRPHGGYTESQVRTIVRHYDETAREVGVDPLLVVAQMVLETGNLTSEWSQPPRRNPAGIGVTGEPGKGVSFPNWKAAVRAHVGRLLAYALPKGEENAAQRRLIAEALKWRPLPESFRGRAKTLRGLAGSWATDKQYATKIVRVANEIRETGA